MITPEPSYDSNEFFKCVSIRDAPMNTNLIWTHAIIRKVSEGTTPDTVKVKVVNGCSPNGKADFDMKASEKVDILIDRKPQNQADTP